MLKELLDDYSNGVISEERLIDTLTRLSEEGFVLSKPHNNFVVEGGTITHNGVLRCYNCEKEITVFDLHLFNELCESCYEAEYGISFRFDPHDPYDCALCGGDPEDCYCYDEEDDEYDYPML